MEAFSRNAVLVLFGSAMLLGMGLVGIFGSAEDFSPGLQKLMSGPAPVWLAAMGGLGIAAVLAVYLRGALPQEREEAGAGAPEADGSRDEPGAEGEDAEPGAQPASESTDRAPASDATVALVEVEVLLRPGEGESGPALGPAVPPAALCTGLVGARNRWICSMLKKEIHGDPGGGRDGFSAARERITQTIAVRGRTDGEAASYRLAFLVHVPPSSSLEDTASTLELLGSLPGDRFLEVAMVRVPEEADTFASSVTVAGSLAAENLLEDAPGDRHAPADEKA